MALAAISVLRAVVVTGVVTATGSDAFLVHVGVALVIELVFNVLVDGVKEIKMNLKKGVLGTGILRGHWCVDRIRIRQS